MAVRAVAGNHTLLCIKCHGCSIIFVNSRKEIEETTPAGGFYEWVDGLFDEDLFATNG